MKHRIFLAQVVSVLVCLSTACGPNSTPPAAGTGTAPAVPSLTASNTPQETSAQNNTYQEDFEGAQLQGWKLESGWQVTADGSNHVLAGLSVCDNDNSGLHDEPP